jgi:hydroxymethylpyrimidine pyrophosphatase-like HAD family hydrolase
VEKWLNIGIQNDACIYHNGAVIKIGDELFQETGIEHDVVSKLLEEAKHLGNMRIAAEINDMLYANFDASTVWPGVEYIMTDFCELPKLPVFVNKKVQRLVTKKYSTSQHRKQA